MRRIILTFGLIAVAVPAMAATTATLPVTTTGSAFQQVRIGNAAIVPNGGMTEPRLLTYHPPAYTPEALQQRIEGVVTVQAAFDIDGNFKVLGIIKRLGYGLDEAALAALETWRFAPAYRSGARVSVVTQIDVDFKLPPVHRRYVLWTADGQYFVLYRAAPEHSGEPERNGITRWFVWSDGHKAVHVETPPQR